MRRLRLVRARTSDQGTPGTLLREDGTRLAWTLELPWRENRRMRSCIPPGAYVCHERPSPKFGRAYEVTGVPGRSNILLHAGNLAGDVEKGLRSNVLGCVLLGTYFGTLLGQCAVLVSRPAVSALGRELGGKDFLLEVSWASSTS